MILGKKSVLSLVIIFILGTVAILLVNKQYHPFKGYTLFNPLHSRITYLINNQGDVVHTWTSRNLPGLSVYLLENGNLLRAARQPIPGKPAFVAGGAGGRIEELDWDGNLVWQFVYSSAQYRQHHDIEKLPNGNILMIAWERKSKAEAVAAGRDPEQIKKDELWPDHIIEIQPTGSSGGKIIWQWHLWDHIVQEYDPRMKNYGSVKNHPELVDINYIGTMAPGAGGADWIHTNAIDYNQRLDQILISVHGFNEIWIIDHSTTTEEAARHTGGKYGKGGDLLYRWGNPRAYAAGGIEDQQLFGQHDAKWIENGAPGQGHILIYNNGLNREGEGKGYSTVVEIKPPLDGGGNYFQVPGEEFGPNHTIWTYGLKGTEKFYSAYISGAQRLPNGNTLICNGSKGNFFEVTPRGKKVWSYMNRFTQENPKSDELLEYKVFRAERYGVDFPGLKNLKDS